jgi:hypothetical protein
MIPWFYWLMGLRSLHRVATKPEFEEDRKQLAAMNDQFTYDMNHWHDDPSVPERWNTAIYHFFGRLAILVIIVMILCSAWYLVVRRHEVATQPQNIVTPYHPVNQCDMYDHPPASCK